MVEVSQVKLSWDDLINHKSTWDQVMAWCRQATSHCLNKCWLRSMSPYGITRLQWLNTCQGRSQDISSNGIDIVFSNMTIHLRYHIPLCQYFCTQYEATSASFIYVLCLISTLTCAVRVFQLIYLCFMFNFCDNFCYLCSSIPIPIWLT